MRTGMHRNSCMHAVLCVLAATLVAAGAAWGQGELTMLEEATEGPHAVAGTLRVVDPAALDVRIVVNYQDNANYYEVRMKQSQVTLQRVVEGKAAEIGQCKAAGKLAAGEELPITVRRGPWRIALIVGWEVLARGFDSALWGGQAGYAATGAELPDLMIQPVGDLFLTDDFVREEDAQSSWDPVTGSWHTESLRTDEQAERMEADKAANAFSYEGKGKDGALAVTGYWFWSNYSVRAAMRPVGTDTVGLVAYYQDPDNYLLARWTSALAEADDRDQVQLVQVLGGERKVLAQAPGGHLPGQWYGLQLNLCDDLVQCFVDEELKASARFGVFGQGQPGLYCEGEEGTFFDSVAINEWEALSETFETPSAGKWAAISGKWQADADGYMRSEGDGERLCVTGREEWMRHLYAADLYSGGAGVGLVACYSESGDYVLRVAPAGSGSGYAGKAELVRRTGEGEVRLAEAPAAIKAKSWHRAKLVLEEGLITAYLDGKRIFDAYDAEAGGGRVGLYADGKGSALFDNAYVALLPPKRTTHLTKEFTEQDQHPEMVEWASTRHPWIKPEEGEAGKWWSKGDYYGDKTIKLAIPSVGEKSGSVQLWLDASPENGGSGFLLVVEAAQGSKTLKVRLLQGEETLEQAEVATESDPCPVVFERKGTFLVVSIDDKVIFSRKQ